MLIASVISALGWVALGLLALYSFGGIVWWAIGERCGGER
jgi:hypothetical protein